MPNVGGKKFAYTPEGEAAAAEYAQQTGAPFQMRAKAFNNSPMQKNFGSELAINKKLDKDSGTGATGQPGPVLKKLDTTSKLSRKDMEGGMTGKPSTGELDGPLRKTKSNMAGINKANTNLQTQFKKTGGDIKTGIAKVAKTVGLKKRTGSIGDKMKQKYSGAAQRAGKVARPGESQHQFKTRTRKPKAKTGHKGNDILTKNIKDKSDLTITQRAKLGEKVYPQEIERVVKVLTGIDDVIAVPMKHEVFGEVVKLFVKKSIESDISKTDILTHCIKNLERFKVPAKIEFVEDFPRTDYGKIKRFMLK